MVNYTVVFNLNMQAHAKEEGNGFALYGMALMLGYLGFDGFTSTFQASKTVEHKLDRKIALVHFLRPEQELIDP